MKTFGKWVVMGRVNGNTRLAHPGFKTRKDAEITMASVGFERVSDNLWIDSFGQEFYITKNTAEYR